VRNIYSQGLLLLVMAITSGCSAVYALKTTPDIVNLKPEQPRNYQLSLDVKLAGKEYHIDYSWACEQKSHYTGAVGRWVLSWQSDPIIVAKQIDKGVTLLFAQPNSAFCIENSTANFTPKIIATGGEELPLRVSFFDARHDSKRNQVISAVVLKGSVTRVDSPSALGAMTSQEQYLAKSFMRHMSNYISREVVVVSEAAWSEDKELASILNKLTKTTRAMDLLPKNQRGSGFFRFNEPNAFSVLPDPQGRRNDSLVAYYSPPLVRGELKLDSNTPVWEPMDFRYEPNQREAPSKFCYRDECVDLEGRTNDIYFSSTRELIRVMHWSLGL